MQGLSPVALGITGLQFALFANALYLLGIDSDRPEGQSDPAKTVGVAGSLIGALGLLFASAWFVIGAPFGREGQAAAVQLLFTIITGMYGFIWLGAAFAQIFGWDLRPVGNLALLCLIIQVFAMVVLASWGITLNTLLIELVWFSYVLVLAGFWAATHGKISTRLVGYACLLAFVLDFYPHFWASGILPAPS
jgi:hypothetical protein